MTTGGENPEDPVLDAISALVEEQLKHERSGYDHNLASERCACGRPWHGLAFLDCAGTPTAGTQPAHERLTRRVRPERSEPTPFTRRKDAARKRMVNAFLAGDPSYERLRPYTIDGGSGIYLGPMDWIGHFYTDEPLPPDARIRYDPSPWVLISQFGPTEEEVGQVVLIESSADVRRTHTELIASQHDMAQTLWAAANAINAWRQDMTSGNRYQIDEEWAADPVEDQDS